MLMGPETFRLHACIPGFKQLTVTEQQEALLSLCIALIASPVLSSQDSTAVIGQSIVCLCR